MSNVSSWDFGTSYGGQEVSAVFYFVSFNNAESATYSICNSIKQAWDVSQICNLCRRHLENRLQLGSEVQVSCVWLVLLAGYRMLNERHTLLCESLGCKTQSFQWRTTGTNRQLHAPGLVSVEPHFICMRHVTCLKQCFATCVCNVVEIFCQFFCFEYI